MIDLKDIEFFKNNYLLLSLICYGLGLLSNYLGYAAFNVPILYYVTLTDLLLYSILQITFLISIMLIYKKVYLRNFEKKFNDKYNNNRFTYQKKLNRVAIVPIILIMLVIYVLMVFKIYIFGNNFSTIFLTLPIALAIMFIGGLTDKMKTIFPFHLLIGISIITLIFIMWTNLFMKVKMETHDKVSFIYNDIKKIETNSYNFYLGETSTHMIMYDSLTKSSTIYKKENIDYLKYYTDNK